MADNLAAQKPEPEPSRITVEVPANVANTEELTGLGVKLGETTQSWLQRLEQQHAAARQQQAVVGG